MNDLSTLADEHSAAYQPGDQYKPCTKAFCDGIEFSLGQISKSTVQKDLNVLLGFLNNSVKELMFKHALISERGNETFMWLTLYPETTQLTPWTMTQLIHTHSAICNHAYQFWGCSKEVSVSIEPSKIDVAVDLQGAFIPEEGKSYHNELG